MPGIFAFAANTIAALYGPHHHHVNEHRPHLDVVANANADAPLGAELASPEFLASTVSQQKDFIKERAAEFNYPCSYFLDENPQYRDVSKLPTQIPYDISNDMSEFAEKEVNAVTKLVASMREKGVIREDKVEETQSLENGQYLVRFDESVSFIFDGQDFLTEILLIRVTRFSYIEVSRYDRESLQYTMHEAILGNSIYDEIVIREYSVNEAQAKRKLIGTSAEGVLDNRNRCVLPGFGRHGFNFCRPSVPANIPVDINNTDLDVHRDVVYHHGPGTPGCFLSPLDRGTLVGGAR